MHDCKTCVRAEPAHELVNSRHVILERTRHIWNVSTCNYGADKNFNEQVMPVNKFQNSVDHCKSIGTSQPVKIKNGTRTQEHFKQREHWSLCRTSLDARALPEPIVGS